MRQCLMALSVLLLQVGTAFSMSFGESSVFFEERPALIAVDRSVVGLKSDFGRSSRWLNSQGKSNRLGSNFSEKILTAEGEVYRTFEVEAEYSQFTPYWGYGVTSSWSIYAAVPITRVSASSVAIYSSSFQPLTEIKGQEVFSERDKSGLRAPHDTQEQTIVGQFYFVNQFDFIRRAEREIVLFQKLRVPTGEHDSLDYYTAGSPEPSGYGIEVGLLSNFDGPWLTQWIMSAKGEWNFSDTIYGYSRGEEGSGKPEKIRRDPGETLEASVGIERDLVSHFVASADFSLIRNFGDKISSDTVAFTDPSEVHLMRAALAYRPPAYSVRRNYGDHIYSGRLLYSQTVGGKNIADYESVGVEISVGY